MARSFNGTDQGLVSGSTIDLTGTGAITVSFWLNEASYPASVTEIILDFPSTYDSVTTGFRAHAFANVFWRVSLLGDVGDSNSVIDPETLGINTGTWYHYALVYDKTLATNEVTIYVNGTAVTQDRQNNNNNTNQFGNHLLHIMNTNSGSWRDGNIADLAIWKSSLSTGNIASLAGGTLPTSITPTPDYYWKICGDASPEPATIGGVSLSLVGSPTKVDHPATIAGSCAAAEARRIIVTRNG